MSLQTRITALVQAIGADIKALYSGKVGTSDARLTDAREWTASTVTQAEAEAGTATTRRAWTAQRVFQAIAAWWAASAMKTKLDGIATGATANATDAQLRDRSTHTGSQAISTVTGLQTALDGKISTTERGVSGGVATLDQFARIPPSQLPSYVDDVLEYLTAAEFPATGETGKIYIAINQGTAANPTRQYRWTGSVYAEINPSPGTTDALTEGSTNLYFNESRVRNTVLTGLSFASSAAVAATDSVLAAFGKIQAKLNALGSAAFSPVLSSEADTTPGALVRRGDFGVGGASSVADSVSLDSLLGGAYSSINTTLGAPEWGLTRYSVFSVQQSEAAAYGAQIIVGRFGGGRLGFRYKSGSWAAWQEVWHTGNLVKQANPTDTTAGALMAVGAFGSAGGTVNVNFPGPSVDDHLVPNGTYRVFRTATPNGTHPPGVSGDYMLTVLGRYSATHVAQIAQFYVNGAFRLWTRQVNNGFGTPWTELFHEGNFNPATKQDKSSLVTTATSRTLALTDAWNYVRPGTTSAVTLTIPTNASVAFEIGTEITVRALGNVTLAAANGVTLNPPSGGTLSMTARMTVTLKKVATDVWDVIGQTVAA